MGFEVGRIDHHGLASTVVSGKADHHLRENALTSATAITVRQRCYQGSGFRHRVRQQAVASLVSGSEDRAALSGL